MKTKKYITIINILIIMVLAFYNYFEKNLSYSYTLDNIPEYSGELSIILNKNKPNFTDDDYKKNDSFIFSNLDNLGRCGSAFGAVSKFTMPNYERESMWSVRPSGWQTTRYDILKDKYLFNRCHLIGFQLSGENANPLNLITCTRSANSIGMLEYENMVANYVRNTDNRVLYRVTPIFYGDNLVASGIEMEASSIEDRGESLEFHVYVYNVEDGIEINYLDGTSKLK